MRVELEEHNPEWIKLFEQEKRFLVELLGNWACGGVEHVGSTVILNISAKQIIDIMFGVVDLASSQAAIQILERSDHHYAP